jgi:predicted aspartyl protease
MLKTNVFIFVFLVFLSTLFTFPQNVPAQKESIISFELKEHVIFVKGKINGHPEEYNFMVDTGGITMLNDETANKLQLKRRGNQVKMNSLDIGNYRIDSIFCVADPDFFKRFESGIGVTIHGLIGSDLLDRFKVTLDYRQKTLVLSNDTAVTGDPQKGFLFKFKNHPINSAPMLKCKLNGRLEVEAMVDTGQPFPLVLPPDILNKLELSEKKGWIKAKGNIYQWPFTTSRDNYLGRIDSLATGNLEVRNVLTFSAELPSMLSVPLLGRDFLVPYITIINYPKNEILFIPQPISPASIPTNQYSIGLYPHLDDNGKIVVRGVWTASPADQVGIAPGDEIVSLNGNPLTSANLLELLARLRNDDIKEVNLEIKNAQGRRVFNFKKEKLLPELKK